MRRFRKTGATLVSLQSVNSQSQDAAGHDEPHKSEVQEEKRGPGKVSQAHVQRIFHHLLRGAYKVGQDGPEVVEKHGGQHQNDGVEQDA